MKKILFVAILALAIFAGCKKDDPEPGFLTVDKEVIDIGSNSGVQYINVESNTEWTIAIDNYGIQGLDVTPLSGEGDGSVKVSYSGGSISSSDAYITFKYTSEGVDKKVIVSLHP